ncbi:unnamed protein product, partial [Coregonus sp. 'balchen']
FFVIEDHILHTTQGLVNRAYVEELWELALSKTIAALRTHSGYGFPVSQLFDMMLEMREQYGEILLKKWNLTFRQVLDQDNFSPIPPPPPLRPLVLPSNSLYLPCPSLDPSSPPSLYPPLPSIYPPLPCPLSPLPLSPSTPLSSPPSILLPSPPSISLHSLYPPLPTIHPPPFPLLSSPAPPSMPPLPFPHPPLPLPSILPIPSLYPPLPLPLTRSPHSLYPLLPPSTPLPLTPPFTLPLSSPPLPSILPPLPSIPSIILPSHSLYPPLPLSPPPLPLSSPPLPLSSTPPPLLLIHSIPPYFTFPSIGTLAKDRGHWVTYPIRSIDSQDSGLTNVLHGVELVQVIINTTHLEASCVYLEEFISNITNVPTDTANATKLYGTSTFKVKTHGHTAFSLVIDQFLQLADYDWTAAQGGGAPSDYLSDLIAFLCSTFSVFTHLP